MKTIQLSVPKMHCESCEKLIASELEDLPGIHHSTITTADKGGEVMFDDEVVSEYQFGYGAVHFFGKLDARGIATEIVAGLIENS